MVSVSRFAGMPHTGHVQFTNSSTLASGETAPSAKLTFSGSNTGN